MKPIITVAVCTYNRVKLLQDSLKSLTEQTSKFSDFEILIIDNNSGDGTRKASFDFIRKNKKLNIRYFFENSQGLSRARNMALREAEGRCIAFLDDDAKADKNWIKIALKTILEHKDIKIFGGMILPFYEEKKPSWYLDKYSSTYFGKKQRYLRSNESFSASNMFIDTSYLKETGGFDERIGMSGNVISLGEETGIFEKARQKDAGFKFLYIPGLKVFHLISCEKTTLRYILKRSYAGGFSYLLRIKHNGPFLFRQLLRHFGGIFLFIFLFPLILIKPGNLRENAIDSLKVISFCSGFIMAFFGKNYVISSTDKSK